MVDPALSAIRAITVLIAEDEPDMRELLRLALERDGRFQIVGEAEDGERAIQLAIQLTPDQIVLDLRMPGIGGLEALPRIRSQLRHTQIVVYSAHVSELARITAMRLGAAGVLEKTTGPRALVEALAELAGR